MKKKSTILSVLILLVAMPALADNPARAQIRIVGSSTVFPFISAVAENFGRSTVYKTPVVESTGTGGGFKEFCQGVGPAFVDLTGASRPIKDSETENCHQHGVTAITEVKIGFDGIVLANEKKSPVGNFTRQQLFLALAKQVPVNGQLVNNPYQKWSDVDPALPPKKIEVMGPPPTSGTRDAFVELVMDAGCKNLPVIKDLDADRKRAVCGQMREDGAYIDAGENDNLIVQKLAANPDSYGIFGHSYLDENAAHIQAALIEDREASFENILSGVYPVARSLYVYVKDQHLAVVAGLGDFLTLLASEKSMGEEGIMADHGMIPLTMSDRQKSQQIVAALRSKTPQISDLPAAR